MSRSRIAALAARYSLPAQAETQLTALADLLAHDPDTPTAVRGLLQVIDQHLADSLVALGLPAVRGAKAIADLGAGAGVPGLPLAIARPDATVALVESNGRKCLFLRRAVSTCGLSNVSIEHVRAEAWRAGLNRQDLVTARALASLSVVVEYAAPLLALGGSVVVWQGARDAQAEAAAAVASVELGLEPVAVVAVQPYPEARHRHLHVMRKIAPTPARFPRRPGVARKRPLGAEAGARATS
jgi:16S rRNA (guanine527-N7)-methyltransferase